MILCEKQSDLHVHFYFILVVLFYLLDTQHVGS